VNGISLTVAELLPESFAGLDHPAHEAPHEFEKLAVGDQLNIEFDLLAKYVERMLARNVAHD
jgi:riboflavin synthase alpha subunit